MKKWLAIPLAILFALAMTFPALAQDPTPVPPAAKMHVVLHVDDPWSMGVYVESGSVQCTTIEGGFYELSAIGTATFDTNDYTCLGELSWHIYYGYGGSHHSGGEIKADVFDTDPFYYDADFQSNYTVSTYTNGAGEAPAVVSPEAGYGLTHGGRGHTEDAVNVVTYFYAHDSTKPPCGENWDVAGTVASGHIAATNESGVAATLALTSEYKLTIWGGPWNDGVADHRDTALKIGADDWVPTADFIAEKENSTDCTEGDPLDPSKVTIYFHATNVAWAIRVNDIAGQFADNTGGMEFQLDLVQVKVPIGCENQFLRGAPIQSGNIDAKNSAGVYNHAHPADMPDAWLAGNWIEIVTSGGPWQDAGIPPDLYTVAIKNSDGSWSELSAAHNTACSNPNGDYVDAWYQLPDSNGIYLRVDDPGGVFGNNSGSMDYAIYSSTYNPIPPAGCAELYQLGDLIKTVDAPANAQNGVKVGNLFSAKEISVQRYYAVETSGIWYDNNTPETWAALAASTTTPVADDWHDIWTYPTAACAVQLDPVGHWRVYFPVDGNANKFYVRAQEHLDSTWDNNSGRLTFKFYEATYARVPGYEPGPMPGAGVCTPYYTPGAPEDAVPILATNSEGDALPALTSGRIYAVETSAGPWHEGDDDVDSYEVAISTDDGITWENLSAFSSAACAQSADGNHILVYFQALAGRHYMLRVYDPHDTFAGNSGTIDYKLYEHVVPIINNNCSDNYTVHKVTVADPKIPVHNPDGVKVSISKEADPTAIWAIEINDAAYWNDILTPDIHHYDAQISSDNGSNWADFGPGLAMGKCILQMSYPESGEGYEIRYRIYFNTPDGALKLRTNTGNVIGVTGHLEYFLYSGTENDQPCVGKECPTPPAPTPPGWQAECYESYLRPSYLFKLVGFQLPEISFGSLGSITFPAFNVPVPAVDDWIAYLQWTVRSYFAWCPEHTAALAAIPTTFDNYEPFGTITEVNNSIDTLNAKIDQLKESGGEGTYAPYSVIFATGGGESGGSGWQGLLPPVASDSPWAWSGSGPLTTHIGENVTFDPGTAAPSGGEADYVGYCTDIADAHFGHAIGAAMCTMTYVARAAPFIWIVIQLAMDVGSVVGIIAYIQKRWIDPRMSA